MTRFAKYDIKTMQRFWNKIRKRFETTIDRKYVNVSRRIKHLISKRKANIKVLHKFDYVIRDDNWTQVIDK